MTERLAPRISPGIGDGPRIGAADRRSGQWGTRAVLPQSMRGYVVSDRVAPTSRIIDTHAEARPGVGVEAVRHQ